MTGSDAHIRFLDARLSETLVIDGVAGDIVFTGADCAEDFDVCGEPAAGSVMCVDDEGSLRPCSSSYDTRVAGVLSGAGGVRPALRLDGRGGGGAARAPVALVGKVFCLADADVEAIGVGDLLTTSCTCGHAMRASDPVRSFGAVLGKSLSALSSGQGLIPILVALQ
jgi:hypothetical protein